MDPIGSPWDPSGGGLRGPHPYDPLGPIGDHGPMFDGAVPAVAHGEVIELRSHGYPPGKLGFRD